jgi:hypothetical protein
MPAGQGPAADEGHVIHTVISRSAHGCQPQGNSIVQWFRDQYPWLKIQRHEEAAMITIPYDPTRESVLQPGRAKDFFQRGPIQSDAALCAEMSRLAYVKDEDKSDRLLTAYLKLAKFTLVGTIDGDSGTYAFVAMSSEADRPTVVIAFRGTEVDDFRDLLTDLRLYKVPWKDGGKVHAGFRHALPDMNALTHLIPDGARLLITGHSLGAALATLAAARLRRGSLYTFGSPRVGDKAFAASMQDIDHSRYVDCCDGVTILPLPIGYRHVGCRHYIDRHGNVVPSPSKRTIIRDRLQSSVAYAFTYMLRRKAAPARQLADHAPINYISAVMGLRSSANGSEARLASRSAPASY